MLCGTKKFSCLSRKGPQVSFIQLWLKLTKSTFLCNCVAYKRCYQYLSLASMQENKRAVIKIIIFEENLSAGIQRKETECILFVNIRNSLIFSLLHQIVVLAILGAYCLQ